jgi:glucose/mannose-6-phosphate isomerase
MEEDIRNFLKQFEYNPVIENEINLKKFNKFIVVGMGGSHLAADLLKTANPYLDVIAHKNYSLPVLSDKDLEDRLIIASSYSGNTEETIDALEKALSKNLNVAIVSKGGKLMEIAQKNNIPYIKLPETGIQPRLATGFSFRALAKLTGESEAFDESGRLASYLNFSACERAGKELADSLKGKIPIFYSSSRNAAIAYSWKVNFNETGRIPAFYNEFPELNHNEMAGFEKLSSTEELSSKFYFIFLRDESDNPKILKRMDICKKFFEKWGLGVKILELNSLGNNKIEAIFISLLISHWSAYNVAKNYGVDTPDGETPAIEEFKKFISTSERRRF